MIAYIAVSILLSIIFGLSVLTLIVQNKIKFSVINSEYLYQFWSFVFFVILYIIYNEKIRILNLDNIFSIENLLLICAAVIPIVLFTKNKGKNKKLSEGVLKAGFMEIPQRLLSQNIFFIFIGDFEMIRGIPAAIVLNGLIFAQFIIVQELINKKNITKEILSEIILSFWFSIFIGLLYHRTGNIILAMISHSLIYFIRNLINKKTNDEVIVN